MTIRMFAAGAGALLFAGMAHAKTVALWPIEWNEGRNSGDFHCRIDPANDFTATTVGARTDETPGRGLPPNPSSDVIGDFACNYSSYASSADAGGVPIFNNVGSDGVSRYMTTTNDVTVEFFLKLDTLPAADKNGWYVLTGFNPEASGKDRWMVTLRHAAATASSEDYYYWNVMGRNRTPNSSDVNSATHISPSVATNYFSEWHHVAYVYEHDCGDSTSRSRVYVDSELVIDTRGTVVTSYPTQVHSTEDHFCFGGRSGGQRLKGSVDYMRVCDEALEPSQFLTAGTLGWHPLGGHKTVAYWPLDSKDGVIDGSNAMGGSPMQMLIDSKGKTNNLDQVHCSPSFRKALAGSYAPNATMTPPVTLDMPDNGSVRQTATCDDNMKLTCPYDATVGSDLTLTNDFTVEGYFRPERKYPSAYQFLFASDEGANRERWNFFCYWDADEGFDLKMYAHDGTAALVGDVSVSGAFKADLDEWTDWKHIALVHEATGGAGGVGKWTVYIDGVKAASVEDSAAVDAAYQPAAGFSIGGRWNSANRGFVGCIDQVRATRAALAPAQFLNAATGAQPATDVLRYWPLNVTDGVTVDGRDATGQGADLSSLWLDKQTPAAYDDAPTITNPDPCLPARLAATGSTRFYDATAATVSTRKQNSTLATFDRAALELVNAKRSMTVEFYYLTKKQEIGWYGLTAFVKTPRFTVSGESASKAWTWRGMYNYTDENDKFFYFTENIWGKNSTDTTFSTESMKYDGAWHHIAIVRELVGSDYQIQLYQDGTQHGVYTQALTRTSANKAGNIIVGGRWSSNVSFPGALSSLRFSEGALKPSEFLNATPATPASATTNAWFAKSVALPYGRINYGLWTAPGESFSLEAKLTLPAAVTDAVELMGAYDAHATYSLWWYGWRLSLKADGKVGLDASCGPKYGKFALGDFSGSLASKFGRSVRLAVTYDADDGIGTWKLYENGDLIGTLQNSFNPRGTYSDSAGYDFLPTTVQIGAGLTGLARDVRQTRGILAAGDLLVDNGAVILVR